MKTIRIGLTVFSVLFSVAVQAQHTAEATPELLAKGRKVYEQNCVVCHGDHGQGDGPAAASLNPKPRNFIKDSFKQGTTSTNIFDTVTKGIPGSPMTSFSSLSESDRWAVAQYIQHLRESKGKD